LIFELDFIPTQNMSTTSQEPSPQVSHSWGVAKPGNYYFAVVGKTIAIELRSHWNSFRFLNEDVRFNTFAEGVLESCGLEEMTEDPVASMFACKGELSTVKAKLLAKGFTHCRSLEVQLQ
jgi:hypothetical protein